MRSKWYEDILVSIYQKIHFDYTIDISLLVIREQAREIGWEAMSAKCDMTLGLYERRTSRGTQKVTSPPGGVWGMKKRDGRGGTASS